MSSTSRAFDRFEPTTTQSATRRLFLESLYREHGPALADYAARRVHDEDAAEDIVQEAFLSILAGRFPVPAVDVRRKLEIIVHSHCEEHLDARAKVRVAKTRMRASRDRRERLWRSWRVAPLRWKDRDDREKEPGVDEAEDP